MWKVIVCLALWLVMTFLRGYYTHALSMAWVFGCLTTGLTAAYIGWALKGDRQR